MFTLDESKQKKYWYHKKEDELIFPVVDGTAKLSGRDYEFRESTIRRKPTVKSEDFSRELQREPESLNRQNPEMTLKPVPIFFRSKVASSVVITMNLGFNSMCRRKKHSLFHWNILTLLGQLTLIWMCYKRSGLTIVEMSIRAEICQILGKDAQSSLYWKRNLQKDIYGPGRDWQRFKQLPDQITYGQKHGRKLVKPLRFEKNKNGQKKKQSTTTLEEWDEFTLSIQMTKSTKKFSRKMRRENWKDLWLQPCRAKDNRASRKWLQSRKLHPKRWRFRIQRPQWINNGKSSWQFQHGLWKKSRAKRTSFWKHKETKRKSTLPHWWTYVTSKKCGVRTQITKSFKAEVVLREGHCKRRLWDLRSFYWAWTRLRPTWLPAKVMHVIARVPDCDGQAADAVSAHTQVKVEDALQIAQNS